MAEGLGELMPQGKHRITVAFALIVVAAAGAIALNLSAATAAIAGKVDLIDIGDGVTGDLYLLPNASTENGVGLVTWDHEEGYSLEKYQLGRGRVSRTPFSLSERVHAVDHVLATTDDSGRVWVASDTSFGFVDADGFHAEALPPTKHRIPSMPATQDSSLAEGRITGMAVDGRGAIWISRAGSSGFLRREIDGTFVEYEGVAGGFPVRLFPLDDGVVAEDSLTPAAEGTFTPGIRSVRTTSASIPLPAGFAALGTRNGEIVLGSHESGEVRRYRSAEDARRGRAESSEHLAYGAAAGVDVLAVGDSGDVWLSDRDGVVLYNTGTGESRTYELPTYSRSVGDGVGVSPDVRSAVVDADGNLWFSYVAGFTRLAVAYR